MSKSSRFSYTQRLVLRRMRRGASLRNCIGKNIRLGKNTLISREVVDGLVASGHLEKVNSGEYILIEGDKS